MIEKVIMIKTLAKGFVQQSSIAEAGFFLVQKRIRRTNDES